MTSAANAPQRVCWLDESTRLEIDKTPLVVVVDCSRLVNRQGRSLRSASVRLKEMRLNEIKRKGATSRGENESLGLCIVFLSASPPVFLLGSSL